MGRAGEVNAAAASKIDSSNINFIVLSLSAASINWYLVECHPDRDSSTILDQQSMGCTTERFRSSDVVVSEE